MSDTVAHLTGNVGGPALMEHVREFAKRVKLSGTPEELESFRYLKAQMDSFGYRTRLLIHDAYISLPGPARVEAGGTTPQAITHSFSRPSPAGGLRGELTYVDRGAEADFQGRDLRGKILLVDGIASPAVSARASAAGAAGQLHISPQEHLHEMCISPVWGNPTDITLAALPTTVVCTIAQSAGRTLHARMKAGEALEAVLHAEVDTGWRPTPLLEAELDGEDGAEAPFILLSGHHDTWYEGVMDNGSANATMLEVARLLASHRAGWRRGLRVCFWSGHSHGRYSGSAWYADQNWDDLDRRCAAHVNVDSTGGIGATTLTQTEVTPELVSLAAEAIRRETGQNYAGKRPSRSSDQSFWGIGIPSMFGGLSTQVPGTPTFGPPEMRNSLGWWWHTPHDLIDKVDEEFLIRDTKVFVHALWRLLSDPVLPLTPGDTASALVQELRALPVGRDDAPPISAALAAAEAVQAAAEGARSDQALMRACRALVSLHMSEGDRFQHDPALPGTPWPVLRPLRDWADAAPDSDAARFLAVAATRACNRLMHGLRQAEHALRN
ncbi:M28 family peptidase [Roseomonas marmotae]|uniref:M28 family peptidase n=1 Tax=Roseomonas marmotae TaxID=2768161 RepID=A0ABS3KFI6_9PROT|nr:M28 family peptidase [Roseomonas marmotae]MBO1076204.1 M28 family peptidase [Roseomonas marmotae]QTI81762.1 M28 family peptidase [Roseomonas marmotae]